MDFKIGDIVKITSDNLLYIIEDIKDDLFYLKGYSYRIKRCVSSDEIIKTSDDDILFEKSNFENKRALIINNKTRSSKRVLYGKILHIDGDKDYLNSCLELYKELGIFANGIYIKEEEVKDHIEKILLDLNPDIIVITGHDIYNGKGIKDLSNYKNSIHFLEALKIIRKHFNCDNVVVIVGACCSHFEALIASGANFSSSPARINIHTYDPAVIAIKVATTSCNKTVDFMDILKYIENKRDAFGGIETKGKMKVLL